MAGEVRVLIVDDSITMRRLIRAGLEADPGITVIGEAADARQARDAVKTLAPDVMTLDVEMPGMDGLEFLKRLMRARPMPVIMISTLTGRGSEATIQALSLGAFDCVEKPRFGATHRTFDRLTELVKAASQARIRTPVRPAARPADMANWSWNGKKILIGSSTGGVEALNTILNGFPENCPPTLITQHMPEHFLSNLAARLNGIVAPVIRLAAEGDRLQQGVVYIAPGGKTHMTLDRSGERIRLVEGPKRSGHRPSVDEMFASAVPHAPRVIAAILTGMGRDGAEEMRALRQAGAVCIGQDQDSSVVYGMPRVAMELGGVETELPLSEISAHLLRRASREREGLRA